MWKFNFRSSDPDLCPTGQLLAVLGTVVESFFLLSLLLSLTIGYVSVSPGCIAICETGLLKAYFDSYPELVCQKFSQFSNPELGRG